MRSEARATVLPPPRAPANRLGLRQAHRNGKHGQISRKVAPNLLLHLFKHRHLLYRSIEWCVWRKPNNSGLLKMKTKKYQVVIHHWGGGVSILAHRNKTEFCVRTAKKHKLDLATRNLATNEFKALHLVGAGDIWGFRGLTK